jgi:hypothetical protein
MATPEVIRELMHPYHLSADLLAAIPKWTITKLDEGPGWSREVLRHRSGATPGNGAASSADP